MRIADAFGRGRPVVSFEFFPPKTPEGVEALYRTVSEDLAPLRPTFVSVTYGAGGSTQDLTVELVSTIKRDHGIEAMCHLTCVGHSAAELAQVLDRLQANGIDNVLALRGDPPTGQKHFERPADGFGYAQELVRFVRSRYAFCVGGSCYPEVHPDCPDAAEDLRHLREKVDSGAEFLISQLFFDPSVYFDFVGRARALGISVPIVPGILPVLSLPQIERFTALCGASIPHRLRARLEACAGEQEVVQAGIDWGTEQCSALLEGGAPGIHFYSLNRAHSVRAILDNLGLPAAA
ncbi:MAG TPA: methylenetetrahydrofolate reductase [NAD(P)H] [Chloroflexota bacterium]|nr:methylenetetrahydrofolate reductase [NAD(P)H] [Chloroflexota bacterium]